MHSKKHPYSSLSSIYKSDMPVEKYSLTKDTYIHIHTHMCISILNKIQSHKISVIDHL